MCDATTKQAVFRVGIAEGAVVLIPTRIKTTGLGSCVGVVLYDLHAGISGLVHVMLPCAPIGENINAPKYADTAIPWLLKQMCLRGAVRARIQAKVAGGAQMFVTESNSELLRIGPRNVQAVHFALAEAMIPVVGADTGGNVGRTIEFNCVTGILWIRTAKRGTYQI